MFKANICLCLPSYMHVMSSLRKIRAVCKNIELMLSFLPQVNIILAALQTSERSQTCSPFEEDATRCSKISKNIVIFQKVSRC